MTGSPTTSDPFKQPCDLCAGEFETHELEANVRYYCRQCAGLVVLDVPLGKAATWSVAAELLTRTDVPDELKAIMGAWLDAEALKRREALATQDTERLDLPEAKP